MAYPQISPVIPPQQPQTFNFQNQTVDANPITGQVFGVRPNVNPIPQPALPDPSKVVPPPAVTTSTQARDLTLGNQTKLSEYQTDLANKNAAKMATGSQETTLKPKTDAEIQLADQSAAINTEVAQFSSMLDSQVTTNNAATNSLVQSIKDTFARRKAETEQLNKATLGGLTKAGIRAGRQRYAPEIEQGILSSEEKAGIQRLTDLDRQEVQLIQEAQAANDEKNFKLLYQKMSTISEARKEKNTLLKDLADESYRQEQLAMQKAENARADIKLASDLEQIDLQKEEAAKKFAVDNKISKPFYQIGSTIYSTGGKTYHNEQEFLTDGGSFDPNWLAQNVQTEIETPEDRKYMFEQQQMAWDQAKFDMQFSLQQDQFGFEQDTKNRALDLQQAELEQKLTNAGKLTPQQKADMEIKLSKDFEGYNKDARTAIRGISLVETGYNEAIKGLQEGKGLNAQSQAVVIGFNKLLDPSSVVRESEYARTPEGQSLLQRLEGYATKVQQGGAGLTADGLKDIRDTALALMDGYKTEQLNYAKRAKYQADINGLDINAILTPEVVKELEIDNKAENLWNDVSEPQPYGPLPPSPTSFNRSSGGSEGTNLKASGKLNTFAAATPKTLASALVSKYPPGSTGGQCGIFVRKVANAFGLDYPRLGDSLTSKMNAVKNHGTSLANAKVGSVIVTKENPTYGHVAWIVGRNQQGFVVAESNFKQSNKVSYGRVIPYNSPKIVGVINPKKIA